MGGLNSRASCMGGQGAAGDAFASGNQYVGDMGVHGQQYYQGNFGGVPPGMGAGANYRYVQPGAPGYAESFEGAPQKRFGLGPIIVCAVLVVLALVLFFTLTPTGREDLQSMMPEQRPQPPPWMLEYVEEAGGEDCAKRGIQHTPEREVLESIWQGTHVEGYPAGSPHGDMYILLHAGEQIPGQYGKIVLSERAAQLKEALIMKGFKPMKVFHGTENPFVPSILSGGFLVSDGMLGTGVYTAKTFAHAQCYAPGEGEPILQMEVYWRDDNRSKYVRHVPHQSTANDVNLVSDPMLVFPVKVLKCCPEPLPCMR